MLGDIVPDGAKVWFRTRRPAKVEVRVTIKGGVSMDQVLARHYEEETAQPSLVLGCEQPVSGFQVDSVHSMPECSAILSPDCVCYQ